MKFVNISLRTSNPITCLKEDRKKYAPLLLGKMIFALLFVLFSNSPTLAISFIAIDDFNTTQTLLTATGSGNFDASSISGGGILGSERDIEISVTSGPGTVTGQVMGGVVDLSAGNGTLGKMFITWDGGDGLSSATEIDYTGLGGEDLTFDSPVYTTTTSGGGVYNFGQVSNFTYTVYIPDPSASYPASSTTTNSTNNDFTDDDNGTQSVIGGPVTSPTYLDPGSTVDFGFYALASDLTLTKTVDISLVIAGQRLPYIINLSNTGSLMATGVVITDRVPISTTYVPGSASDGGSESGGVVQWSIGTMLPNTVVTRTFQVTVASNFDSNSSNTIFFDDMENGGGNWTAASGLWHLKANSGCGSPGYSSPTTSWYYGQDGSCDYDTGNATSGSITTVPIALPNSQDISLSFDYFRQVENTVGVLVDTAEVSISPVGSPGYTALWVRDSRDASENAWTSSGDINISAFTGQEIQLRFRFDSVDDFENDFIGWMVDDVLIEGEGTDIINTAYFTSNQGDSDSATISTPVSFVPDLSITKSVTPTTVVSGKTITYTLTFSNSGRGSASGIVITDIMPISLMVTSIISGGDVALTQTTTAIPTYTFTVADMAQNNTGYITIIGVLTEMLTASIFTNTTEITTNSMDSDTTNNSSSASVTISKKTFYLPIILKNVTS